MIKRILLTAAVAVIAVGAFTTPALAAHCPKDVKKIEAHMSMIKGDKMMMMAKEAASKGMALHKAGKHAESIKVLHKEMESLGIKH